MAFGVDEEWVDEGDEESLTEALQRVIVRSILARHQHKSTETKASQDAEALAERSFEPDPG